MREKAFTIFIILILLLVSVSGIFLPAENVFSYVNTVNSLGEERSLLNLIFSTNRIELKNKIETYIFKSQIRNSTLSYVANLSWYLQDKTVLDSQFFDTEVFFGKNGDLFPKIKSCQSFNNDVELNLDTKYQNKIIFLLVPLKQEIDSQYLNYFQNNFLCEEFNKSYNKFINANPEIISINLYELYEGNERYFEFGDTHWNNYGLNLALMEILKVTNPNESFELIKLGLIQENNNVLERLGLIKFESNSSEYLIQPIPKLKKDVLIIHDSFFDEAYASNNYLSNYFNLEYQRWSEDIDLDNKAEEFDFVLIESSIESFFETRISNIINK